jgi:hypothetical protein
VDGRNKSGHDGILAYLTPTFASRDPLSPLYR